MAEAVRDFHAWTGGESIEEWGVESLLTSTCARHLATAIKDNGDTALITMEQTFAGILAYSQRWIQPGRRPDCLRDVEDKPGGKVDLVLWTRTSGPDAPDKPRAMIEIKRSERTEGLCEDAVRVINFVRAAGASYGGTVRYGAVATLLRAPTARAKAAMKDKVIHRKTAVAKLAKKHGMSLNVSGPRWVGDPNDERGHRTATVVFVLSPSRA